MHEKMDGDPVAFMRAHVRDHMAEWIGEERTTGIEIAGLVRMVANLYDALAAQHEGPAGLSGPRLGILLRLLADEKRAPEHSPTPTYLARCQNVSKNTISSLLRGLEDQGYVRRELDDSDRRLFRIRLTEAGRGAVHATAPRRAVFLNQLTAELTPEEQDQLIELLGKLYHSVKDCSGLAADCAPAPIDAAERAAAE